jgi:Flp pilus assembly protein TadB
MTTVPEKNEAWITNETHRLSVQEQTQIKKEDIRLQDQDALDESVKLFQYILWVCLFIFGWVVLNTVAPQLGLIWDIITILLCIWAGVFIMKIVYRKIQ